MIHRSTLFVALAVWRVPNARAHYLRNQIVVVERDGEVADLLEAIETSSVQDEDDSDMRCADQFCEYSNGAKYKGPLKDGKRHGHGIYKWADGGVYIGEWKDDYQHGNGESKFADGGYYVGEHKHDLRNGYGVYKYDDGGIYEGEWRDGLRHGRGIYQYPNGETYKGEFRGGYRHGNGISTFADGSYSGEWEGNERHGKGIYNKGGVINEGHFIDGEMCTGVIKYPNETIRYVHKLEIEQNDGIYNWSSTGDLYKDLHVYQL